MSCRKFLFSLFLIVLIPLYLCSCGSVDRDVDENELSSESSSGIDYEYKNLKGQIFSFHCSDSNTIIYEKTVNQLITEWKDNVALAERTYNQQNVMIVAEGYIRSIEKGLEQDSYYLLLSENEDSGLFSMDELRVYFQDESTLDSLLLLKSGDYITLVCSAQDTTFFLEYPELKAELVLEAIPVADSENGIASLIGHTVSDIISQYGNDYIVDCWSGGMYITYDDCPYNFYYSTVEYDSDWNPNPDDKIWGVETFADKMIIDGAVMIGGSLESAEDFWGSKFELYDNYDYDGNCGTTNITRNNLKYTLTFDRDSDVLISASCWAEFIPPSHPDIIQENIDKLEFNYGDIDNTKEIFMLCLAQDDLIGYYEGKNSLYNWKEDFEAPNFVSTDYWFSVMDDLDCYLDGEICKYEELWEATETAFYMYAAQQVDSTADTIADNLNKIYHHLGEIQ